MAKEISVSVVLNATKGFLTVQKSQSVTPDMSGAAFANHVQNVGTSQVALAVPTEIATLGYGYLRNLDATNYVEVGVVVSATFYPVLKLKAGEISLTRFSPGATLYAKANTAAVNLEFCILAD